MRKTIILLSGKLHSGKNSLYNELVKELSASGFKVKHSLFAREVKEGCYTDFKMIREFLKKEFNRLKVLLGEEASSFSWMDMNKDNFFEDKTPFTRRLLQIYGIDIFRDRVDADFWVKKTLSELEGDEFDVCVITDNRYPSENRRVKEWGEVHNIDVYSVRIDRPSLERPEEEHDSETALDDYEEWDMKYINEGPLERIKDHAIDVIRRINSN